MASWNKFKRTLSYFITPLNYSKIKKVRLNATPIPLGAGMLKYEISYDYEVYPGHQEVKSITYTETYDVITFFNNLYDGCDIVMTDCLKNKFDHHFTQSVSLDKNAQSSKSTGKIDPSFSVELARKIE